MLAKSPIYSTRNIGTGQSAKPQKKINQALAKNFAGRNFNFVGKY